MAEDRLTEVQTIDVGLFLSGERNASVSDCKALVENLRQFGAVVIRDPRVTERDNDEFIDMLEAYFEQDYETKLQDARPDLHYQIGVTPDHVELPRPHTERINTKYADMCRPLHPVGKDPKWRFFWRIGDRPTETSFPELNEAPVIPAAFPQWATVMDRWGSLLLTAVENASRMLAVGLDMDEETFSSRMKCAPHLLAPTASDLDKYGDLNTILAGFHYDLNFLTIHGKSRYPALNIFLRDDSAAPRKKMVVKVPDGCLLIQAGKELEWLTGGAIQAGYHEVIVQEATVKKIQEKREANESLWRISSTLFSHIASDQVLEPLGPFKEDSNTAQYPPTRAGDYVESELAVIKLAV
eukprot:c9068_g1_i1.p1 GENE.c9068_g1_i1~~c9068_g1_i1.p1  ORF type:complete len:354 (+),score=81.94 c9068_g1_i1:60-1121(+)